MESGQIRLAKRDSEHAAVRIVASRELLQRSISAALQGAGLPVTRAVASPEELLTGDADAETVVVSAESDAELVDDLKLLRHRFPEAHLVAIVSATTPRTLRALLDAGSDGLVLDDGLEDQLVATISAVRTGQVCVPKSARGALSTPALSPREKQIMAMVVMGFSNKEIARKLYVTESTIKSHLSSAFAKLGARTRSDAARLILDEATGFGTGILAISEDERVPT